MIFRLINDFINLYNINQISINYSYEISLTISNILDSSNINKIKLIKLDDLFINDIIKDYFTLYKISINTSNCKFFEKYPNKIVWTVLSKNPFAIHILKKNLDKIDWSGLSSNLNAIDILAQNQDKIDWKRLSGNPNAICLLSNNQDKIDWMELSLNPNAFSILVLNEDKINWYNLSRNKNPCVISILQKNLDKIDWFGLSGNHNALSILSLNQDKINFKQFAQNSSIIEFEYEKSDYDNMLQLCNIYKKELIKKALHPSRIQRYLDQGMSLEQLDNLL